MADNTDHKSVLELIPEIKTLPGVFVAARPTEIPHPEYKTWGIYILDPDMKVIHTVAVAMSEDWAKVLACGLSSHIMEAMDPEPGEVIDRLVTMLTAPPKKDMN